MHLTTTNYLQSNILQQYVERYEFEKKNCVDCNYCDCAKCANYASREREIIYCANCKNLREKYNKNEILADKLALLQIAFKLANKDRQNINDDLLKKFFNIVDEYCMPYAE